MDYKALTSVDWYDYNHSHFRMYHGNRIQQSIRNGIRVVSTPKWYYFINRNLAWYDFYKAHKNPTNTGEKIAEMHYHHTDSAKYQMWAY